MDELLKLKADLLAENYMILKRNFKWEASLVNHFGAMVHTTKGVRVNPDLLRDVRKHLKEETSWVSQFRGTNLQIISSLLCLEDNYQQLFANVANLYKKLRDSGFHNSTQLPLSAFTIAKTAPAEDWDHRIDRMKAFYSKMREKHFWITSTDDYVHAAILATTDMDVDSTSEEIESCYHTLNKGGMYKGNYLQTLSHVLALGEEETRLKCHKAIKIFKELKDRKCNLNYYGLASVGVLSLIAPDTDKIVEEVTQVYDYIYTKDGYGFWSLDRNTRSILAASLVSDYYLEGVEKGLLQVTLGNSIAAIIIAQQTAAISAACAASASAAATSS